MQNGSIHRHMTQYIRNQNRARQRIDFLARERAQTRRQIRTARLFIQVRQHIRRQLYVTQPHNAQQVWVERPGAR